MKTKVFWSLFAFIAAVTLTIGANAFGKKTDMEKSEDPMHWYLVQYDQINYPGGAVLDGSESYIGYYEKSEVPNACSGNQKDCLRGFEEQLDEEVFSIPLQTPGDESILRD